MTRPAGRKSLPVLGGSTAEPAASPGGTGARFHVVTLGCDKNTVDSERLLARLGAGGGCLVDDASQADVVVLNTCGFIDAAREESIDAILEAVRLKESGRARAVVAVGCLVQRYRAELQREIPEVDLFLGLTEAERLVPELRARGLLPSAPAANMERPLRALAAGAARHTAHLKVSEGCDHACAFCAIPLMRGKHRSTPIDVLVREARELERRGVVELNLVSQDTTWYGRDFARGTGTAQVEQGEGEYFVGRLFPRMKGIATAPGSVAPEPGSASANRNGGGNANRREIAPLPRLLQALLDETSIPWLRLFYMYPSGIRPELVELMARERRIVPYLDMPIQHGSDAVLRRMRRPERRSTIRERVRWLRSAIPSVTLRTTVIVGFPGETEEDFEAMLELLEEVRFDRVGAFAYSVEEDTPAALMSDQVPEAVRRERLERLLELQASISLERNEARVGEEVEMLIDRLVGRDSGAGGADGRGAVGRTVAQAAEVDGVTHMSDAGTAQPGEFVRIRITGALEDDLIAEPVAHG